MRRKGVSREGDSGSDVEAVLDELYATPPAEFVARREVLAAAARTAGRAEDARRIHAARRPTLAAWAANRLLRSRPEESRQFLELGQALREAYRTLDSAELKELSAQRRRVVSALSRQAAQLAHEAGHRLSDSVQQDVESTLRAVLTDPDAAEQWAKGRLEGALTPPSAFPSDTPPPTRAAPRTTAKTSRAREKDEVAERRRQRQEQLTRARRSAAAAERRLRDQRTRQAKAEASLGQARDRHARAEERLRKAQEEVQHTAREQQQAEEQYQAATDALAGAEREARDAAEEVDRLRPPGERK
ncbi:hypothetical protein ACGFNV_38465 [Streptomyces sp. NPDC048751]|uniref:hypothetical protein n=1 Tax=Streptomyces sp. NPDC048751 TaxID=3365591 RepID=UPI00371F36BB